MKETVRTGARRLLELAPDGFRDALFRLAMDTATDRTKLLAGVWGMDMSLRLLRANGLAPEWIVDVGAYVGGWSRMARSVFDGVPLLMIEANGDCRDALHLASSELGDACVAMALLGREPRAAVPFHAMATGSSVLPELTDVPRSLVPLPMTTLDAVSPPGAKNILLKLDVQGYELEVLAGGARTLAASSALLIEASLLPYNDGAPLLAEVVAYLRARGFVSYDVCGALRRRSDLALWQTDLLFVPEQSRLRERRSLLF
jgi:FkbM family methyltransferase